MCVYMCVFMNFKHIHWNTVIHVWVIVFCYSHCLIFTRPHPWLLGSEFIESMCQCLIRIWRLEGFLFLKLFPDLGNQFLRAQCPDGHRGTWALLLRGEATDGCHRELWCQERVMLPRCPDWHTAQTIYEISLEESRNITACPLPPPSPPKFTGETAQNDRDGQLWGGLLSVSVWFLSPITPTVLFFPLFPIHLK